MRRWIEVTTIGDLVDRAAEETEGDAVVFPDVRSTYPELSAASTRMARSLRGLGVGRGDKVGVLMGTAYLFTAEAVASGAIGRAFQDAAVACERTALVETAPGHATRCAESDFVDAFARERARLEAEGTDPQAMWGFLVKHLKPEGVAGGR